MEDIIMKKVLFMLIIIIALVIYFKNYNTKENVPPKNEFKSIVLEQELVDSIDIVIVNGNILYKDSIVKDNWIPFNTSKLEYELIYNYSISYSLKDCKVEKVGNKYMVILKDYFNYNNPTLISQDFNFAKQIFGKNISENDYNNLLNKSRENVFNEIKNMDNNYYKIAVEKNILTLVKKFGILDLDFIWIK
jgi:hypothetical protein